MKRVLLHPISKILDILQFTFCADIFISVFCETFLMYQINYVINSSSIQIIGKIIQQHNTSNNITIIFFINLLLNSLLLVLSTLTSGLHGGCGGLSYSCGLLIGPSRVSRRRYGTCVSCPRAGPARCSGSQWGARWRGGPQRGGGSLKRSELDVALESGWRSSEEQSAPTQASRGPGGGPSDGPKREVAGRTRGILKYMIKQIKILLQICIKYKIYR